MSVCSLSMQYVQSTCIQVFYSASILQKGNWADRSCDEKHGYICMKQSTTERTGDEVVEVELGCKAVSEVYT